MNSKITRISKWLVFLSVISIFGGLIAMALPPHEYDTASEGLYYGLLKVWHLYLFLPITIASIVFGLYYKKRGHKVNKNIVVGIIFSILLILYGSMGFIGVEN